LILTGEFSGGVTGHCEGFFLKALTSSQVAINNHVAWNNTLVPSLYASLTNKTDCICLKK